MKKTKVRKRVGIICFLDGYANSNKPTEIFKHLKDSSDVVFINTINIFRLTTKNQQIIEADSPLFDLPRILLFILEKLKLVPFSTIGLKSIYSWLFLLELQLRAKVVAKVVNDLNLDLVIGESPVDSLVFLEQLSGKTLYDCATPLADELYFGNKITKKFYDELLRLEINVYKKVDYLSFHWEVYNWYVKEHHYQGKNMIVLSGGCSDVPVVSKYNSPPRIVYFGYLGGYWINLPLLSRLSKIYPHIDVYGSPKPDEKYELNYKGYAKPEVLKDYQFGLITLSDDILRREGFSAKHLEYLSFGLPVLLPKWRKNSDYFEGTLTYDEDNFLAQIKKYSDKKNWESIHQMALSQAKKFRWSEVLKPLDEIVENS